MLEWYAAVIPSQFAFWQPIFVRRLGLFAAKTAIRIIPARFLRAASFAGHFSSGSIASVARFDVR
jgi:hypothetical protein